MMEIRVVLLSNSTGNRHKNLKIGRFVTSLGAEECGRESAEEWL